MNQSHKYSSISGNTLILWEFGRPAETIAAAIRHPNGKPFLLVASPEVRLIDPTFDEDLFRNTLKAFLVDTEIDALWIEYELPDGTQEGEELVLCPACHRCFALKQSIYKPGQLDYAELSIPGQLAFLHEHFGHDC